MRPIFCVSGNDWLEKHAAEEFAKYVKAMTGAKPAIVPSPASLPKKGVVVSVGKTSVSDSLFKKRLAKVAGEAGEEGFLIKSADGSGGKCLLLLGGSPRGTLYAVYHYLEKFCGVGFFWDGERIPKLEEIPVDGIDVFERPYFPIREYMMDCEYTSYWWGWKEWKREVDWAAKHRFNVLSSNFDFTATWRRVWKKFGVEVPPTSLTAPPFHPWAGWHKWDIKPPYPESFQDFIAALAKKFVAYGRRLGMKMAPDFRGFLGQVPKEFYEAYRDKARFIEIRWAGFDPPGKFIHPADPLYRELWKAYLEEYVKRYGTDHLYAAQTYSEMEPGRTPEEQKEIDIAHAKKAVEAVKSVDPQGVIFTQSWTWLNRKLWPKENVKAFLDAFPEGDVMVWELWNDNAGGHPMYKEMDYYFGKPWLMGFLYSYGGQTNLHGDLAGLVKRVREVATEPKAKKCLGIAVQPEAMHHNHVFFDILSRLGWNPMGVELGSFLEEYAFRRYGKESAPKMVRFLKELAASVYGSDDTYPSLYHLRIYEIRAPPPPSGLQSIWKGAYGVSLSQRSKFIPHLQRALEIALEEAGRLGECPLFQHDLIDVGRQFLADLFNLRLAWLYEAFKSGDKKTFGKEAHILDEVLQSLEMLLSSNDYFCLQPILDKAMALPDVPKDFDQRVRDILTIWDGKILDYARRDYYELVRFYYRKRVNAFINYLEEKIAKGSNEIRDDELSPLYHEIEQSWVRKPFRVKKSEKYAGTTAEAAEEIIKKHGLTKEELRTIKVLK